MLKKFKRIKREILRKSRVLTYCEDTMELPDGRIFHYDTMLHNGASAVLPVTDQGKIVMVSQYRHVFDRITLEVPAGARNGDEDFEVTARRELEEEAGLVCGKLEHFITIDTAIAYSDEVIEVYIATDLKKTEQHPDPDEFLEVREYELSELMDKIYGHEIRDSKTIAILSAYAAKINS